MHGRIESPNTSPHTIVFDPSCSGQAHTNRLASGFGCENTEPGCILAVLRVPFIIRPLRSADAKSAILFTRFRAAGTNGRSGLSLSWRASENPLKRSHSVLSGPEIHGKPRRVFPLVGKTQLAGCLKVWVKGSLK